MSECLPGACSQRLEVDAPRTESMVQVGGAKEGSAAGQRTVGPNAERVVAAEPAAADLAAPARG